MAQVGGPIESVDIKGRVFAVAADADSNRNLGGFTNEIAPNGDGGARLLKTRVPWKVDGLDIVVDNDRGDLEFLQDRADELEFFPITVTYPDGNTYAGKGQISGDFDASSAKATVGVTLMGPNKLEKQ